MNAAARRRSRARCAAALVLAAALGSSGAAADERSDAREAELDRLRRAIEARRERVEAFEREQRGLLDAVEAADRAAAELQTEAARRAREAEAAGTAQREIEVRLPELEARLARTRAGMSDRVVALYKTGTLGPAEVLFSARSLQDLLERVDAIGRLLAHDRRLALRFRDEEAQLAAARLEAIETRTREKEALAALRERRAELEEERGVKARLLAAVRSDRAREQAALEELEAAARALEETLAKLAAEPPPPEPEIPAGPPFATLRGHLAAPVDAPVVRRFGKQVDARFQTELFHKGVDFGAARGTVVRAVAAGRVRFAGWFRGYGRIVILDHGDRFYTVSGHLDEIRVEVGQWVAPGDAIGTVGDTGSLSGPRLYFEIRAGGRAEDPQPWLRAAEARAAG